MKPAIKPSSPARYATGLLMLALGSIAATLPAPAAQEDFVMHRFDAEDEALGWTRWWGNASQAYEFDSTTDAAGSAASGSLKATIGFDLASLGGENQFAVRADFPGAVTLDGTGYLQLKLKLRWAASSPKTANNDFGYLEYGFRNSDWSQTWLGGQTIASASGDQWTEITAAIDPALAKLDTIAGVVLKLWSGGTGGLTGETVFWVDDITLVAKPDTEPTPPPSLTLSPATPGLRLAASAAAQPYQRQNIRTQAADADGNPRAYGWLDQPGPVSYAITVRDFPGATNSGFQLHLFLVPEAGMPNGAGDTSIDWNARNVVFLQLANNADGSATSRFMYKTNLPSGNSMFWNGDSAAGSVGNLGAISDSSPLGTWTVTFRQNTEVTLTSPSGSTTNFALPAAAAALFTEPLYAYVGSQPNNDGNIGRSATLGRVQITGTPTPLDDSFAGETLDSANWQIVAADAPGIQQVPSTSRYWLVWKAPATGFLVQSASLLNPAAWVDAGLSNVVQVGASKMTLVPAANLPSATTGFFRLLKP